MAKVLFIYPNKEGYPIIPLGISVLSGVLKDAGHKTDLFDITFMMKNRLTHDAREEIGSMAKVDVESYWGRGGGDINEEFKRKIRDFNPDLLAFSVVENNYGYARRMFKTAKEVTDAPIIAGGLFPTIVPKYFINDKNVDITCIGEGENAMLELTDKLDKKEDFSGVKNLITKDRNGKIIRNPLGEYYTWNPPSMQDWDIFDERHLMKPFMGKMYKTGFFELARGCPFNCSYCINDKNQKVFSGLGNYNREKPIDLAIKEIKHMKNKHSLELIFFNDENFLTMKQNRLEEFSRLYQQEVGLPFFIMTRAERVTPSNLEYLKDAGCVTIGMGVETGNEKIRRELLNKKTPNSVYEKAFQSCRNYGIRSTANIMIGLPFETEENIIESADFCKKIRPGSVSLSIFAPYQGTKLRDTCVENGFIEDKYTNNIAIISNSILNMPQISKAKIREYYMKFNDMVYEGAKHT